VNGTEVLPMMVEVALFADTNQMEQLIAPYEFEFFFIDADIDTDTGLPIPPGKTDSIETSGETESPDTGTEGPSGAQTNPLTTPTSIAAAGGALTLTGYGIYRALKKPKLELGKGSKLDNGIKLELDSKAGQLDLEKSKLTGEIETGQTTVSDEISTVGTYELEAGTLAQSEMDNLITPAEKLVLTESPEPDSTLRIEGNVSESTEDVSKIEPEISVNDMDAEGKFDVEIGINYDNGNFSARSQSIFDTEISESTVESPSPVKIDPEKIDVSEETSTLSSLELKEGSLANSHIDDPNISNMASESAESFEPDGTMRIEGNLSESFDDVSKNETGISVNDIDLEGEFRMEIRGKLDGAGSSSARSHTILDGDTSILKPKNVEEDTINKLKSISEKDTKNTDDNEESSS
jgi:hypothetical protein